MPPLEQNNGNSYRRRNGQFVLVPEQRKKVGLSLPAIIARLTKKKHSLLIEGEGGVHFRPL